MDKKSLLAATAYHEAGHAVAAVRKAIRFKLVTIKPGVGSAGHVQYLRPATSLAAVHKRGMVALAGEAAQRQFSARSVRSHHGAGDREAVISYALSYSGSQEQAKLLTRLWGAQAQELVKRDWSTIQCVATALLERQTLTLDDVRAVVFRFA